jgi:hypothetical protein
MTRTKKIAVAIIAVILLAAIGVTAVFAVKSNPEEEAGAVQAVQQAEQALTVSNRDQAFAAAKRSLNQEQLGWIMYAIENGRLPELTPEQLADLYEVVMRFFEDGFAAGFGSIDPEVFSRMFAMYENSGMGDFPAVLREGQQFDLYLNSHLERALDEGAIPQALYDLIVSAMETGGIAVNDGQAAELRAFAVGILTQALAEGKIPQALYDIAVTAIETGDFEPTAEQIAQLQEYALGMLDRAFAEGMIPTEYYDTIRAAIGTLDFKPLVIMALDKALEEGKIAQEWYDMITAAIGDEDFKPLAIAALDQALEEGAITQEYYDIIITAMETGEFELTDGMKADLKAKAKEQLQKGLAAALEEGIITQNLYGILITAIETGSIEPNTELIMELHISALTLLTRLLDGGVITQEQYDALVSAIGDLGRQLTVIG